ncbi:MAG TPA: ABC transporter permease [Thermomicrobiales bacterium]|nr:ABC transporter permease [Thermomicrobiales bacterium]
MVGRAAYIRKRLLLMIFVLFGVTLIIFSMIHLVPGDPAFLLLGDRATEETAAQLRQQLGLNQPLPLQYWHFISGIPRGDFGTSILYRQPVNNLIWRRVPVSIFVALYAMVLTAIITIPVSIWAATHRNKLSDHLIRVAFLFALATPGFWLGILLILLFGLRLHLFPVAGYGVTFPDHLHYLFLPALTLALNLSAVLIRNLRSQIISTLDSDFVRTARAKGLTNRRVLTAHVLRNALVSTVSLFGLQFGGLIGGTVIIETVFAIPGIGHLLFTSITARDYPVVQAITVITAFLVIVVTLLVDLSYSLLDPRVSYE